MAVRSDLVPLPDAEGQVSLLTPELQGKSNQIVVDAGHKLVTKREGEVLRGRCDSFVVETDVHYATAIRPLFNATRKVIDLSTRLSFEEGLSDWGRHAYNVQHLKRHLWAAQSTKHGKTRSEAQKEKNDDA